jgi:hypothetical protein
MPGFEVKALWGGRAAKRRENPALNMVRPVSCTSMHKENKSKVLKNRNY